VLAAGGSSVTYMEVWLDGVKKWQGSGRSVDQSFALANGSHKLSVYGKGGGTVLSSQKVTFMVGTSTPACSASGPTDVTVCSPTNGSTVNSPFHLLAAGGSSVAFMEAWLDGTRILQTPTNTIDQSFAAEGGTHSLTVYGKDASNTTVDTQMISFSVPTTSTGCAAPSSAGINVCSPSSTTSPGSTVSSPVHVQASATVSGTFARMELWIDGVKRYTSTSDTVDVKYTLAKGVHKFSFYAFNTAGTKWNATANTTVK